MSGEAFMARNGSAALLVLSSMLALPAGATSTPALCPVIPLPNQVMAAEGAFAIRAATVVRINPGDSAASAAAHYLIDQLARSGGLKLALRSGATPDGAITFETRPGLAAEAYRLQISPRRALITASTAAGLFYGAVTLWQLASAGSGAVDIPAQDIHDAPLYAWRGLMLDSSRHFQSPMFVRGMIDWMAWHKLNVLHWHLTDDQGWRLQIRRYPRLTDIGAWRTEAGTSTRYGGFYTQDDVRAIVAYARTRHVLIVPEIDMPGHAQAAIAAYPMYGAHVGPAPPVSSNWGVHEYLFNLEPATFRFLDDVLDEVIALFPSPYIHIGGDEAVKSQWKASAAVQARARALGISDPSRLQAYFTQRIARHLARRGRRMVGWDEVLEPGLREDAVVMSWRGTRGAHTAAIAGNDTVLTPWPTLYFDNQQSALGIEPPGRMQVVSLKDVYSFEPRDRTLTPAERRHVLGVQANLWSEHIRTEARMQWMALPRAAAVAELGWTRPQARHWEQFLQRLAPELARYRVFGFQAADSVFAVDAQVSAQSPTLTMTLSNQGGFGDIRFTTDGSDPSVHSPLYQSPLQLTPGGELRAATFVAGQPASTVLRRRLDAASLAHRTSRELDLCTQGVALLLESAALAPGEGAIFALDIMNPCWIERGVALAHGAKLTAAVAPLPFNFEVGAEKDKIKVGDARTALGELEVRLDGCEGAPVASIPLPSGAGERVLPPVDLPARAGRHDLCLRFARPAVDPIWALDWVEIAP